MRCRDRRRAAGTGAILASLALALASPAPAAPPGLVAAYDLDGALSAKTPDTSGNGLDADMWSAPSLQLDGHRGGAFRFTATRDAFTSPVTALTQTPAVTAAAWVRSASTPLSVKAVLAHGASGGCSHSSYAIYTGPGPQVPSTGLRFYVWNGTQAVTSPVASNAIWDGAWHHVAGTYDGAAVRLYVDGAQVGSGTPASGPIGYGLLGSNRLTLGNYAGNLPASQECIENTAFGGDIDEVRIFNRALGDTEITAVMTGVDPAPPPTGGGGGGTPGGGTPGGGAPPVADRDGDGVPDATDRCPDAFDPAQADADGDGIGDACEVLPSGALAPVAGVRVASRLVEGEVLVRLTPNSSPVPLAGVASLPVGAIVDARKGQLDLRAAGGRSGRSQSARIAAGIFQIRQNRARRGRAAATDLVLRTPPGSARACAAAGAPRKGVVRRLTVAAKGVFRTVGGAGIAKGRGATWSIADRCDGTLTRAIRGRISVRANRRTVVVRPGESYLARARLFGAKVRRQGGR